MRLPTIVVKGDVLASWLTISDYTRSRLATELGVSKGRISQLLTSHEEPSAHLIAKLMLLTHLPFDRLFRLVRTTSDHHEDDAAPAEQLAPAALAAPARARRSGREVLVRQS